MIWKSALLLILFALNLSTTVFADSFHGVSQADSETSSNSINVEHTDHESEDHCGDHDQCHNGHYHHYLLPQFIVIITLKVTSQGHLAFDQFVPSTVSEIIKPPLSLT